MGKYTDKQLMSLTADPDFQHWIETDSVLDRLYADNKRTVDDRLLELGLAFGGALTVAEETYIKAPTPGAFLLLGVLDSPYLRSQPRRLIDVDIALYVLGMGKAALDDGELTEKDFMVRACNCTEKLGISREDADTIIVDLMLSAFKAFELLPQSPGEKGAPQAFDMAWYAWLTATVAMLTGLPADKIGWEMPVGLCLHYVIAEKRRKGLKICDQTPKEKILERMHEMMDEWIAKKGW